MLLGSILALLTGLCFATGAGLFASLARRHLPFMIFLCLGGGLGLVLALLFVVNWGAIPTATRTAEVCFWIILGALANVAGHRAMVGAMKGGQAPVAWAIGQGGQAVPFVASVVIWKQQAGILPWVGVFTIIVGVAILAWSRQGGAAGRTSYRVIWLALLALACYGMNNTLMAVPSYWVGWEDTIHLRLPLTLGIFSLGGASFSWHTDRKTIRQVAPLAIPYGLLLVVCFALVYWSLDYLGRAGAAGFFWPIACGTGVTAYAAWEHLLLRKPIAGREMAGIATIVAGIVVLAARH